MHSSKYKPEIVLSFVLLILVSTTIMYGGYLYQSGVQIRRWNWGNLLLILPVVPLLFLQQKAGLPSFHGFYKKKSGLMLTVGVGIIFGLLDVIIIKGILHPEPYTELPPFLQPFPYSIFLYSAGALEIELYYRMIPLTIFLLIDTWVLKGKLRYGIIIGLGIITSLVEPIQQFPEGAVWFILYATISGIAMNAWQFFCYIKYGFLAALAVRLGHYLLWHILLGIYVQYFELVP